MSARPSPARDGAGARGEPDRPRAGRTAEFDVAVIGAGPAGCAAALAAASLGARVLLVDRGPALGGNVGNAFVHTICGLYELADDGPARFASPGLASRVAVALVRAGAAGELERAGRVWVLPTDPRAFARALDRALAREPAIERALPAELVALELGAPGAAHRLSLGAPREVGLGAPGARASAGGEGRAARGAPSAARTIAAWIAIDASGDGDAAALAGAATEIEPPDALQNPSYVLALRGVAADAVRGFARMRLAAATGAAARHGALPRGCESLLFRPGLRDGEAFVTVNLRKPDGAPFDPLDAAQRERLAARARADAAALVAFLRRERAGFEAAELGESAARIGVREARRVVGCARIEAAHVLRAVRTRDEVARACWPIELWHGHERAQLEHVDGACSVPLGALVARDHPRLAMAGRCLSASHEALGSLRVIGTALATGEAAGAAAALAANARGDLGCVEPARVREAIAARADLALLP